MLPFQLESTPVQTVQLTAELTRILHIPRRIVTREEGEDLARDMSRIMRKPGSQESLRWPQALALYEMAQAGGFFGPLGVGVGKTLTALLSFFVLRSQRPLCILPAKLVERTKRQMVLLHRHWPIPEFIRFVSYEYLGRQQSAQVLEAYRPDVIVADEAHKLKSSRAACTRRVTKYMAEHPTTKFVALSGTMTTRSIKDYAQLLRWCIKGANCPIPFAWSEIEDWADALDEKQNGQNIPPGALLLLATPEERRMPPTTAARHAVRRRITETLGVIAYGDDSLGCSLTIEATECGVAPEVEKAFYDLRPRDDGGWLTPDGWELWDPIQVWRTARELAVGFYYKWDPRPPQEWLEVRRNWAKMCRYILQHNRRDLFSPAQVVSAIEQGHYPEATPVLRGWRQAEPTFTPNTVPVWIDDSVLRHAESWGAKSPGLIWVEHVAFGEALSKLTGLPFYSRGGFDAQGNYIENDPALRSVIVSKASNLEGRDLQHKWSRNLVVGWPSNGLQAEQLLGRTHRAGQRADDVQVDILLTCWEHAKAFYKSKTDAQYIEHTFGARQKLNYADDLFPMSNDIAFRSGPRWVGTLSTPED